MKKLLQFSLLLILLTSISLAQVSLGNHCSGATNSGSAQCASTIDTTGNSEIWVGSSSYHLGATDTLTDSHTGCASPCNTWTGLTIYQANVGRAISWYCNQPCSVGTTHQFVLANTGGFPAVCAVGLNSTKTSSAFDQQNGASTTGATTLQTGSVTTASGSIALTVLSSGGLDTNTINSSFTKIETVAYAGGVNLGIDCAYKLQTGASENPTWTLSLALDAATSIATFLQAPAGGAVVPRLTLLGVGP